ncbi:MAG: DUF1501 domain-containing protein [Myxococcota bacterium]
MNRKCTRRQVLRAGLGASQVALLGAAGGLQMMRPSRARAALGAGPKRLLTIHVRGGWSSEMFFCPLSRDDVRTRFPEPDTFDTEPSFFEPEVLQNLDGTGDAEDPMDPTLSRIRVPWMWDEAAHAAGDPGGSGFTPHGYAWRHHALYENASVLHGIDMGTAAHKSGRICAYSGKAGPIFTDPAIHAFVADALLDAFPHRPLGVVKVGAGMTPNPLGIATGRPVAMTSLGSVQNTLSERDNDAWAGLRDRAPRPHSAFDGTAAGELHANDLEAFLLSETQRLNGRSNPSTTQFFESLYGTTAGISRTLALDVVSQLEQTTGFRPDAPIPHWIPSATGPLGTRVARTREIDNAGLQWQDEFDLALRLMKRDVCSAISLEVLGVNRFVFDTHTSGPRRQFLHVRLLLDVLGRFLHEMKVSPGPEGGSLLDETLVLIFSEFGRTWPPASDHWPFQTLVMAGGNVVPNRMIGNYEFPTMGRRRSGLGAPVPMTLEDGSREARTPRMRDVHYTALHAMGLGETFLPGGPGVIDGVLP